MDSPDPRLAEFGFDSEAWLERARIAAHPDALGQIEGYAVIEVAAIGGQATVYRCRRGDGGSVALKRLHGGAAASRTARDRLARELSITRELAHPAIVAGRPVEIGGELLVEMDWVEGVTLSEWARGEPDGETRTPAEVLAVFDAICEAVHRAHERGVVHRDLKPSNVLIDGEGRPHILDFGIARPAGDLGATHTHLTLTDQLVGTPAYASPEQVAGAADNIDARSDLYSLGVMLYEALTGKSPYPPKLSLGRLLCAIEDWDPPRPRWLNRRISKGVEAVILKALRKDPRERYASVNALREELARCRAGSSPLARCRAVLFDARRFRKRHPVLVALALLLAIPVLALTGWLVNGYLLTRSGQAFVDKLVPEFGVAWDPQVVLPHLTPEFLEVAPPDKLAAFCDELRAKVGPMTWYAGSTGSAQVSLESDLFGESVGAWRTNVACAEGIVLFEVRTIRRDGAWWIRSWSLRWDERESPSPPPAERR